MRTVFVLCISALMILSCNRKEEVAFTVEGNIRNADAGKVYLIEVSVDNGSQRSVDSSDIKDGVFRLQAKSKEEGLYYLRFDNSPRPFASFINDSKTIKISGDFQFPSDLLFSGSAASTNMKNFYTETNKKWLALGSLGKKIDSLVLAKASDSLVAKTDAEARVIVEEIKDKVKEIVLHGKSAVLALMAIQGNQNLYAPDEYSNMLRLATETYPEHMGLKAAKNIFEQQLAAAREMKQTWTGKQAPEITLPDVNGKTVSLSSFKGRYVLVDFWASWCKPCRQENPNVVAAYQNFKAKNFTVLGVSLDENKNAWLKAIEKDGLTWTHVSDLKQWQSSVVPLYRISGIPFNVLVDPKGTVIAENLRGSQLQAKLNEVLK